MKEPTTKKPPFFLLALPFIIINGTVWGIGIVSLPLLAGTPAKAGLTFAMINLGIATGSVIWGKLSGKIKLNQLIFIGSVLSFLGWLAIFLLNGKALIPLAFVFGNFTASIFALASVVVTTTYPKELWDKYIAQMQAYMTLGTSVGLLVTALYAKVAIGLPFLFIAIVAYLPFFKLHKTTVIHHPLHFSLLKPKGHFAEMFTAYFHVHLRKIHLLNFKNKKLLFLNVRWLIALLAPAPVYAMYPLLMKKVFMVSTSESSLVYSISTAIGIFIFILAGKISKKKSAGFTFNSGITLYLISFVFMLAGIYTKLYFLGIIGFVVMILSWSFISTGMNISVVEIAEESKRGEALGIANSLQSIDNVIGGAAGGFIVNAIGYPVVLIFGFMFSGIALILRVFKNSNHKNIHP